ncbi:MAG: aminoacetone oxidase family FAD-binding enzyme [Clostridia bacterium]|nr:aminoacetone oxidase family FAD-binding enzyme [Clostridia bacterium]
MRYDAIIVGGGAAGLIAACALALRGRRVVLLEKQPRVGRKLLSTGNGRCNLTNLRASAGDYHGARAAAQAALKAWPPKKVMGFFEGLGVPCVPDEAGRVYPMSRQAASVLDALRLRCAEAGVEICTDFAVSSLVCPGDGFEARAADGRAASGRCALVCTGGLAAPKLGACGDGYRLLEGFGHRVTPRFPAIAALKTPPDAVRALKGIRAEGEIALLADGEALRTEAGEALFSETGVSGIAAMQLARLATQVMNRGGRCEVRLNLAPGLDAAALLSHRAKQLPERTMEDFLNGIVPRRLGQALAKSAGLEMSLAAKRLSDKQIARLAGALGGWTLPVTGVQGFDQAQVTAGGASLKDFDIRCMQSLRAPGLFAAGEVLDVDGDCGGFNLQWAWSSALMAAEGIDSVLAKDCRIHQ